MSDDVLVQCKTFLERESYPLEGAVARAFAAAGFSVSHSILYNDSETGTIRELDVVAKKRVRGGSHQAWHSFALEVVFLVECKHAKSPWIVLAQPVIPSLEFFAGSVSIATSVEFESAVRDALEHSGFFDAGPYGSMSLGRLGHGLKVLTKEKDEGAQSNRRASNRDPAYVTLSQILSGERGWTKDWRYTYTAGTAAIVIPVLVLEGAELVEAWIDKQGELRLEAVPRSVLGMFYVERKPDVVFIVKASEVDRFAESARHLESACQRAVNGLADQRLQLVQERKAKN